MRAKIIASVFIGLVFFGLYGILMSHFPGILDLKVEPSGMTRLVVFVYACLGNGMLLLLAWHLIKWVCK